MKHKITFLMLIAMVLLSSCSSDDDSTVQQLTNVEKLSTKSLWVLDRVEVTEILDSGGSSMTKQEFSQHLTDSYNGFSWRFSENGKGSLTIPDFGILDFNYTIPGNDVGQDNFTIDFDVPAISRTVKTKVSNEQFSYEWDVYSDIEIPDVDAEVRAIFIYK